MSTNFMCPFNFDSDQENQVTFEKLRSDQKDNFEFNQSQSTVLKPDQTQTDKFISNKISKNLFFNIDDIDINHDDSSSSRNQVVSNINYGQKRSPMRRKKGNATIKLQPLNTLQLRKTTQTIELIKAPSLIKAISTPVQLTKKSDKKEHVHSIRRQSMLNFEIITSSDEQNQNQELQNPKSEKLNLHKTELPPQISLIFEDSDNSEDETNEKIDIQNQSNKNNSPNFKPLTKKRSLRNNDRKKSFQKESSNEEPNPMQNKNSESKDKQTVIKIQSQPNPQLQKNLQNDSLGNKVQEKHYSVVKSNQNQQKTQFENIKNLLINSMMQNSVLNLKIKRIKSLLNYFSPEFRVEFSQDNYFLMNSKKTSSKPTSTFAFTGSQSNYEQFSSKYLGKMKSNIGGSIYNIFAQGYSPSDARVTGIAPRQLLATIVYTTEMFGTGRPKQFTVFAKKSEYKYYRDIKGVKIYDEETPLNELYNNFEQNRDKIDVFHTRKPVYSQQTKEYVMNFCGKVRYSSIKNFILEDRRNENQKVLLFGKSSEDQYVLDVHSSITPIVGIGIALTVFDTRMGSD